MTDQIAYLKRAFDRMRDEALQSVHHERAIAIAQGAQRGLGGNTLLAAKNAYDRAAAVTTDKMVRLAFELTGNTAEPVCTAVEQGLRGLRDALSNDLAQFFREQASWAPLNATDALGNDFLTAMDRRIEVAVDDLSHGIAGGAQLSKDPLVSVIANITNSPGAVLQGGIGNVQHATSTSSSDIRSALAQFISSKEVQSLGVEEKQSVADVADVLVTELDKPGPDRGKIARWSKRLIDVAEKLGVGVAASGLSHVLFGS